MKTIYVKTHSSLRGEPIPIGVQQLPDDKADELIAANRAGYVYLDDVPDFKNLHVGCRAWVLGCGPSLNKVTADQWFQIDKDITIGVNDSPAVHDVKFLLFLDQGLEERFECIRTSRAKFKFTHLGQKVSIPAIGVMRSRVPTERIEDGLYWNGSSAHAALNLALIMGCDPIVLLGVDYRADVHAAGRKTDNPDIPYGREQAVRNFTRLAELAAKNGTTIINANPDSAVQCFARTSLAQLLRKSSRRATAKIKKRSKS